MDTVLSVATRAVLDACTTLGLDADALLDASGLRRADVHDPDARLAAASADALWRTAYERANDPHLALHAAESLPFGAYGAIDFIAANSPSAGSALERIARYFAIVDPRAVLDVAQAGGATELTMRARDHGVEIPAPAQEYTLAALVTRTRACVGAAWSPGRVDFTHRAPSDPSEHRRVFQAEVRFGCAAPRLVLPSAASRAPITTGDPALLAVLESHAQRLLRELPPRDDLSGRIRAVIAAELSGGEPTVARVARRLGTSERSLQRRIGEEGGTFAALLAEVRAAVAKAHLEGSSVAIAEVAWLLGFSDQSTFTRAFRRWTGETPAAWRAARRA